MRQSFYTLAVWGNSLLAVYPEIEECIALPDASFTVFGKEMKCYIIDIPEDLEEFIGVAVKHDSIIRCYRKETVSRETNGN